MVILAGHILPNFARCSYHKTLRIVFHWTKSLSSRNITPKTISSRRIALTVGNLCCLSSTPYGESPVLLRFRSHRVQTDGTSQYYVSTLHEERLP